MSNSILLDLPEDIAAKARAIAETTDQSVEQVLLDFLKSLAEPLPSLPFNEQKELDALQDLSDDALWTIARDQLSEAVQERAHVLMSKNNREHLSDVEQSELDALVQRADRLMVRKAEAAAILRQRGYTFTQHDFRPEDV